jgi:acetyl-CoA carboxylase carboxyltransferase component
MRSLAGCGEILARAVASSGVVPQIAGVFGPCRGAPALVPALADFLLMVEGCPRLRKEPFEVDSLRKEPFEVDSLRKEPFGVDSLQIDEPESDRDPDAEPDSRTAAHFLASDDAGCLMLIRLLLSYLPSRNGAPRDGPEADPADSSKLADPGGDEAGEDPAALIPAHPRKPYDMRRLVRLLLDAGSFLEVQGHHARNLVVGFGRLAGRSVGVVANQPSELAGVLDVESSLKGARFVRFCDAFDVPLLSFVDVPGFLPGVHQENGGIIKHGAKLIYAFAQATVPKLTVVVRKAYGGAYAVMASKHLRADTNFAFPTAEIAVMGPEAAVGILYRKELAAPGEPGAVEARRARRVREYEERFASPYAAAELGFIDAVIEPRQARRRLIDALRGAGAKKQTVPAKKHGNIPL